MNKRILQEMTLAEAVDQLSFFADITSENFKTKIERFGDVENTLYALKQTFSIITNYLKDVYQKEREKFADVELQNGIRAMVILAAEAVKSVDRSEMFAKSSQDFSVKALPEYKALQEFYEKKLVKKFHRVGDLQEFWKEGPKEELSEIEKRGIRDLESVKQDKEYELFFIKKEDGKPFFNKNLLRHIKLVNDFDKILRSEFVEDPFLKVQHILDKDALSRSKEIKENMSHHLHAFFLRNEHFKSSELYEKISYAIYALMLATSHNNLIEEGGKKSCSLYLADFKNFLLEAFLSTEYLNLAKEDFRALDGFMQELLLMSYDLCMHFFLSSGSKDQMIGMINKLLERKMPKDKQRAPRKAQHLFSSLQQEYDHIEEVLKEYPNGPLFKTMDNFVDKEMREGFDPIVQENYPRGLYTLQNEQFSFSLLRMPSPTSQLSITEAYENPLFTSFIRSIEYSENGQKYLYLNLQNRTSWQEYARCNCLESLAKDPNYIQFLEVCTFAKDTSFYHQIEEYETLKDAKDFKDIFKQQLLSGEDCGYSYSKSVPARYIEGFITDGLNLVHEHFFALKKELTRKNRLDFIEIFYNFFFLKVIDLIRPTHLSFSCKDAVDIGPTTYSSFFAFTKILSEDFEWSIEEEDFFVWMVHSPAFLFRDRIVQKDPFARTLSALSVLTAELETDRKKIIASFEKLYGYKIFKNLNAKEIT